MKWIITTAPGDGVLLLVTEMTFVVRDFEAKLARIDSKTSRLKDVRLLSFKLMTAPNA